MGGSPGQRLVEWDPYTIPIITERDGIVHFVDLVEGLSIREIVDENGGGWEEEKKEEGIMRENNAEPRERVRTDPFLDLSIPVMEGTG